MSTRAGTAAIRLVFCRRASYSGNSPQVRSWQIKKVASFEVFLVGKRARHQSWLRRKEHTLRQIRANNFGQQWSENKPCTCKMARSAA